MSLVITMLVLAIIAVTLYIWMGNQYVKYKDHPDRALWARSNEQIQAEIDAEFKKAQSDV